MLVISRRKHESIRIDDEIEVIVVELHRSSVKLGVRAPKHITVLRAEIVDAGQPRVPEAQWRFEEGALIAPEAGARIGVDDLRRLLEKHGVNVD